MPYLDPNYLDPIVCQYKNDLVSLLFTTDNSNFKVLNKNRNIALDTINKINVCKVVKHDIWLVTPESVVQVRNYKPKYYNIDTDSSQYYSLASNGETAFGFGSKFAICLNNNVEFIEMPTQGTKLHIGTVYCNGSYWSMPSGKEAGYNSIVEFDGEQINNYPINQINNTISSKYSDITVVGNILYALPFGETAGLNEVVEFNTETKEIKVYKTQCKDFAKKYSCSVLIGDKIIAVPYGEDNNCNWGLIFDTKTKQSINFGVNFRGYQFRSGIRFNTHAVFFPLETPDCPILKINVNGAVVKEVYLKDYLLGRPIMHNHSLKVIGYHTSTETYHLLEFNEELDYKIHTIITN